mgnify:CR=1 FL=1
MKQHLSLERHRKLGEELHAIRTQLLHLQTELSNSFPKNSKVSRRARKAFDAVNALRCELDNELATTDNNVLDVPTLQAELVPFDATAGGKI